MSPLCLSVLFASPSLPLLSELEELLQALKWAQYCLTDVQSQQDVELIMQLLAKEDFRNAYTMYSAVSQQKSRVSPSSALTAQAEDLCQEVRGHFEAMKTNIVWKLVDFAAV